ncbi:MAG: DUF817 domain-containing protein [Fimbriimonadaceae bacterium]|nr:MAG: DUF817 domain-containing protein [Fimbriimonadaceae bacterium]
MGAYFPGKGERLNFLWDFVRIQIIACSFPFTLVALIAITKFLPHLPIARYDLLFLLCVLVQFVMVKIKLETWRDASVVAIFHLLGLLLEIYKVNQGSWSYPEHSVLKIAGAPLYSGFMHASVASYMCLAWKKFDLKSTDWPTPMTALTTAAIVYAQFFFPSWPTLLRIAMLVAVCVIFGRSQVHYTVISKVWRMPMAVAFVLIGIMIWIAENLATYFGAWKYPYQLEQWQPVHAMKIISWTLLMMVSLVIVAEYKRRLSQLEGVRSISTIDAFDSAIT